MLYVMEMQDISTVYFLGVRYIPNSIRTEYKVIVGFIKDIGR